MLSSMNSLKKLTFPGKADTMECAKSVMRIVFVTACSLFVVVSSPDTPRQETVCVGDNAIIVRKQLQSKSPVFTWCRDDTPIKTTGERFEYRIFHELTIYNITASDGGKYDLELIDSQNGQVLESTAHNGSSAYINVNLLCPAIHLKQGNISTANTSHKSLLESNCPQSISPELIAFSIALFLLSLVGLFIAFLFGCWLPIVRTKRGKTQSNSCDGRKSNALNGLQKKTDSKVNGTDIESAISPSPNQLMPPAPVKLPTISGAMKLTDGKIYYILVDPHLSEYMDSFQDGQELGHRPIVVSRTVPYRDGLLKVDMAFVELQQEYAITNFKTLRRKVCCMKIGTTAIAENAEVFLVDRNNKFCNGVVHRPCLKGNAEGPAAMVIKRLSRTLTNNDTNNGGLVMSLTEEYGLNVHGIIVRNIPYEDGMSVDVAIDVWDALKSSKLVGSQADCLDFYQCYRVEFSEAFAGLYSFLLAAVDTKCGLLDELEQAGLLSRFQMHELVKLEKSPNDQVRKMLHILEKHADADKFPVFCVALRLTNQGHVVDAICQHDANINLLSRDKIRETFVKQFGRMPKYAAISAHLRTVMLREGILSQRQVDYLSQSENDDFGIQSLFYVLERRPASDLVNFQALLAKLTKQQYTELADVASKVSDKKPLDLSRWSGFVTPTDEPCCVSEDDDPNEKRAKMPCGCVLAVVTLRQHVTVKLDEGVSDIECPGGCAQSLDYKVVLSVLSAKLSYTQLDEITRKWKAVYVSGHDIHECGMCGTHCARDPSDDQTCSRYKIKCQVCSKTQRDDVFFCWQCGQRWVGGGRVSCGNDDCENAVADKLKLLETGETIRTVSAERPLGRDGCPSVRACPHCTTLIYPVSGCKQVKCRSCQSEFCFRCLRIWHNCRLGKICELAPRQTSINAGFAEAESNLEAVDENVDNETNIEYEPTESSSLV